MQSRAAPSACLHRDRRAGKPRARRPGATAARGVLVFVDPRIAGLGPLAATPAPPAGIIPLDVEGDGLRQIAAVLAVTPGVRAVVLAAHSMAGQVALGDALLSRATLPRHAAALRAIGRALGPRGLVLFHGCAEAANQGFMADMAALSRIQVAACAESLLAGGFAASAAPLAACGWSG